MQLGLGSSPQAEQHTRLAWACYFLLGCGFLAPWNAFITAVDYFEAVFPGCHVDRLFTICYLPTCLAVLGIFTHSASTHSGPGSSSSSWVSVRFRVMASFAGFTAILMAVPVLDVLLVSSGTSAGSDAALGLVLLSLVLVAFFDGCCQGAIFGDAATLPPQYTHAVVGGTASSGVVISFLRILTKASLPPTRQGLRSSTAVYFSLAAAISLSCCLVYGYVLPRLGVVVYWRRRRAAGAGVELSPRSRGGSAADTWQHLPAGPAPLLVSEGGEMEAAGDTVPLISSHTKSSSVIIGVQSAHNSSGSISHRRPSNPSQADTVFGGDAVASHQWGGPMHLSGLLSNPHGSPRQAAGGGGGSEALHPPCKPGEVVDAGDGLRLPTGPDGGSSIGEDGAGGGDGVAVHWQQVLKASWGYCGALFLVCMVTLSIFPGFLAEDVQSAVLGDWYPIVLITLFNVADFMGKLFPFCGWQPSQKQLLGAAVARACIFLPGFIAATALELPAAVVGLMTFALGLTNGFLTALVMTLAPLGLPPAAAELTGNLTVVFLISGLTVGAFSGWLWLL